MFDASDAQPRAAPQTLTLATDAACDSFIRRALGPRVEARLLTQRSGEAAAQSLLSQDYALLQSSDEGRSLCFCVCDGVGSSFSGDYAATYLAMRLIRWLAAQSADAITPSATDAGDAQVSALITGLSAELSAELATWASEAQARLRQRAIVTDGGALAREALTELRDAYGSETVFFAGRVDLGPENDAASALLLWLGNVTGWRYDAAGVATALNPQADDAARWSTARGVRGRLGGAHLRLSLPQRLIVHTDGAEPISGALATLDDAALQAQALRLRAAPGSDDLTLLDIHWHTTGDATGEK